MPRTHPIFAESFQTLSFPRELHPANERDARQLKQNRLDLRNHLRANNNRRMDLRNHLVRGGNDLADLRNDLRWSKVLALYSVCNFTCIKPFTHIIDGQDSLLQNTQVQQRLVSTFNSRCYACCRWG